MVIIRKSGRNLYRIHCTSWTCLVFKQPLLVLLMLNCPFFKGYVIIT